MDYYVYVLQSIPNKRTYTGFTSDLKRRLKQHNAGEVKSTKAYRPYKILLSENFSDRKQAKEKELYYKNYRGRQKIKTIIELQNSA